MTERLRSQNEGSRTDRDGREDIDGILVQPPLPEGLDKKEAPLAMTAAKLHQGL